MAKYSAQLVAKSSENKNVTTTLSNVNPETTPVKIKQFAQTLNALTTNTYNETNYIVTTNLDTEAPPVDTRQTPTISVSPTPTLSLLNGGDPKFYVTTNSDGKKFCYCLTNEGENLYVITYMRDGSYNITPSGSTSFVAGNKVVFGAAGTETYKPVEIEFTLE